MKLVFFSDTHLGFVSEGRETEAFNQCLQAIQLAIDEQPQAIVFAGDLFHHPIPSQETWKEAMELFSLPGQSPQSLVTLVKEKDTVQTPLSFKGIPLIAIHGTHEHRARDYANALEVLDKAGLLIHVHAERVRIQLNDELVVVHGLSGIPEKKALDVLRQWNPKPVPNTCNILVLHQSIKEFLPFEDEMTATIALSDLPEGFDLIVDGHLHWSNELNEHGKRFLLVGSTIMTQMKHLEAQKPKGIFVYDTQSKQLTFKPLLLQRKLYYEKLQLQNATVPQAKEMFAQTVTRILEQHKDSLIPLVRIKFLGTLAQGYTASDLDLDECMQPFAGKAIFSVDKAFAGTELKFRIKQLADLQKNRQSIAQYGLNTLEKNLEKTNFSKEIDPRYLFELLENEENEEKIMNALQKKK